jgi:hypothetical protein
MLQGNMKLLSLHLKSKTGCNISARCPTGVTNMCILLAQQKPDQFAITSLSAFLIELHAQLNTLIGDLI